MKKGTPLIQKVGSEMLDQLTTKVRPNERYETDGAGLFVPGSFGVPNFSPKLKAAPHSKGPLDLGKNLLKNYHGGAVDIHKAIGKLPKPKRGFTLLGHRYTGPYNPLEEQLEYDPKTGEILETSQMPTAKTHAIAIQVLYTQY